VKPPDGRPQSFYNIGASCGDGVAALTEPAVKIIKGSLGIRDASGSAAACADAHLRGKIGLSEKSVSTRKVGKQPLRP
jgi:hypothetical protein